MNMQQMLQQVKKLQREYEKAHKVLEETTFEGASSGLIKVYLKGDFTLEKVEILDADALKDGDKDILEESITLAYKDAKEKIMAEEEKLNAQFQKMPGGMFF